MGYCLKMADYRQIDGYTHTYICLSVYFCVYMDLHFMLIKYT